MWKSARYPVERIFDPTAFFREGFVCRPDSVVGGHYLHPRLSIVWYSRWFYRGKGHLHVFLSPPQLDHAVGPLPTIFFTSRPAPPLLTRRSLMFPLCSHRLGRGSSPPYCPLYSMSIFRSCESCLGGRSCPRQFFYTFGLFFQPFPFCGPQLGQVRFCGRRTFLLPCTHFSWRFPDDVCLSCTLFY